MTEPEKKKPRISLIVAVSRNGVIGRDQTLPWNLPEDLKRFKEITYGSPVIMGRKTFQSIGRLLPGRKNVIITRQADWIVPNAHLVSSLEAAIAEASSGDRASELFILGGGEIYRLALPLADRLYVTEVDVTIDGDTTFPYWPALANQAVRIEDSILRFTETKREERPSVDGKTPSFRFLIFDRE